MKFKHLIDARQSYCEHFFESCSYSVSSLIASFAFLIHAVYPDWFQTTGSNTIFNLAKTIETKYSKMK
jgi:hypothetical protein